MIVDRSKQWRAARRFKKILLTFVDFLNTFYGQSAVKHGSDFRWGQSILAKHLFIPDEWKQWIALNLLQGQTQQSLLPILVNTGFSKDLCRLELETAASHPYLAAAQSLARQRAKIDWLMHTQRKLEKVSPRPAIERRSAVPADEFVSEYYSLNRPVIITDAISRWQAITKWNRDYLGERLGDRDVEIHVDDPSDPDHAMNPVTHRQMDRFSSFLETLFSSSPTHEYVKLDMGCEILNPISNDIDDVAEYLEPTQREGRSYLWMRPAGMVKPLHHDLTNTFIAQVVGRKRIQLISPSHWPMVYNDFHSFSRVDLDAIDFDRYPNFRHVHVEEIILEPGDLFLMPVGWWYQVVELDTSITITFTNFRQDNDFAVFYKTFGVI